MGLSVIYEPSGRAGEYAHLALNPWGKSWCSHDCTYCYCPGMFRISREQWRLTPFKPRKDIVELVRKDAAELSGTNKRVLCCFAGDLYSPEGAATRIPREILQAFREFDVPFTVLTKGGMRAAGDFDLYDKHDAFAVTMTFLDDFDSLEQEAGAAVPFDRMEALKVAHGLGIHTWVSLEPVLDPTQSLEIIDRTHEFVDLYKVGKLNHDPAREAAIDWHVFGCEALEALTGYGKAHYFKLDLLAHMPESTVLNTDTRSVDRSKS